MDHVRRLRFRRSELVWLAGNTFYGRRGIFEPAFLEWLEHDFHLSEYEIVVQDGQYNLTFDGTWVETTMWELYALPILSELRSRASMKNLREFGLDILYARVEDQVVEQDRAAARRSRPTGRGFWNAAAAQFFMAGICGQRHGHQSGDRRLPERRMPFWRTSMTWKRLEQTRMRFPMVLAALADDERR